MNLPFWCLDIWYMGPDMLLWWFFSCVVDRDLCCGRMKVFQENLADLKLIEMLSKWAFGWRTTKTKCISHVRMMLWECANVNWNVKIGGVRVWCNYIMWGGGMGGGWLAPGRDGLAAELKDLRFSQLTTRAQSHTCKGQRNEIHPLLLEIFKSTTPWETSHILAFHGTKICPLGWMCIYCCIMFVS